MIRHFDETENDCSNSAKHTDRTQVGEEDRLSAQTHLDPAKAVSLLAAVDDQMRPGWNQRDELEVEELCREIEQAGNVIHLPVVARSEKENHRSISVVRSLWGGFSTRPGNEGRVGNPSHAGILTSFSYGRQHWAHWDSRPDRSSAGSPAVRCRYSRTPLPPWPRWP